MFRGKSISPVFKGNRSMCVVHRDINRLTIRFVGIKSSEESGKEEKFPKSPKIDLNIGWVKD